MYKIEAEMINEQYAKVTIRENGAMKTLILFDTDTKEHGYAWTDDGVYYIMYNNTNVKFRIPTSKLNNDYYECDYLIAIDENCTISGACFIPSYEFYCEDFIKWLEDNEYEFIKEVERNLVDSAI